MVAAHASEISEQRRYPTQCRNPEDHELNNTSFEQLNYHLLISYSCMLVVILLTNIMHVTKMKTFFFIC
jgi:hypothetical protein